MKLLDRVVAFSFDHPRLVAGLTVLLTALAVLGSLHARIDTDPENMLEPTQKDRVVYNQLKRDFRLHDLIVVGIVDERGIFRPEALERIARATGRMAHIPGVITETVMSLTTTDNARSVGGLIEIHPVMRDIPRTDAEMAQLRSDIATNRFLNEKLASKDGRAVAVYLPIRAKDQSYRIAREIESVLKQELLPGETYHVAGLPIAEDTFGHEMFVQMALIAPLAFLGILLLVYLLFGVAAFLLPVGLIAVLSVIWTMAAMIATGHTVHIMGSMIPVFLMPIAILDSIYVLSEFLERYPGLGDRRKALLDSMGPLYRPMLFSSATTAVGFLSLLLGWIPPVRLHGLFVALGVAIAWVLTHTLLPATFALLGEGAFAGARARRSAPRRSWMDGLIRGIATVSFRRARLVIVTGLVLLAVGIYGTSRLRSDDNPVNWFRPGHPLRQSDSTMNRLFGGTYMANLVVVGDRPDAMHRPEVMSYIARLQARLETEPAVGKTSSVADIVKRINYVLHDEDPAYDAVPDSGDDVGQMLFIFQGSGDPNALDNLLDREARQANIWAQMRGGNNSLMQRVENDIAAFERENPPPAGVTLRWSGLNHINRVWQGLMVTGMLLSVLGSFVVVFLLMWLAFHSLALGALSMVPLSVAILVSYGIVGLSGKDYDMPIAVCSSLSLGVAIEFSIHYLERFRWRWRQTRDLEATNEHMAGAPGRAILRNALVISLGFLPLVASTLTPYVTVSLFFAALMLAGALATLFILPAALRIVGPRILT